MCISQISSADISVTFPTSLSEVRPGGPYPGLMSWYFVGVVPSLTETSMDLRRYQVHSPLTLVIRRRWRNRQGPMGSSTFSLSFYDDICKELKVLKETIGPNLRQPYFSPLPPFLLLFLWISRKQSKDGRFRITVLCFGIGYVVDFSWDRVH